MVKQSLYEWCIENNSDLYMEWHPTKNEGLTFKDIGCGSTLKVWWLCSKCGNEWAADPHHRINGRGCPRCGREATIKAHSIPRVGESLADLHPDLVLEWHLSKNGPLSPYDVKPKSGRKVWWHCSKCGFDWQSVIANRSKGVGCPKCTNTLKTSFGEKALFFYTCKLLGADKVISNYKPEGWGGLELDVYIPEYKVAVEFDGPFHGNSETIDRDNRKTELCVDNEINLIRIRYPGLPEISGGTICLMADKTDTSMQSAIIDVLGIISSVIGKELEIDVNLSRDHISILELQRTGWMKRSLTELHPEYLVEWHPSKNGLLRPDNFSYCSNRKVWWICSKCGYEWQAPISHRYRGDGCPECARKIISKARTMPKPGQSFGDLNPELITQWHPVDNGDLTPFDVKPRSSRKVWWHCTKCGNDWEDTVNHRTIGVGCPKCANAKRALQKSIPAPGKSLGDMNPNLAKEWHPNKNSDLTPFNVKTGSSRKVWWSCPKCGHEWSATVSNRTSGRGCPKCKGARISKTKSTPDPGKTLLDMYPDLVKEWHPNKNGDLTPNMVGAGSRRKVWWLCPNCGHEWESRLDHRSKGVGCPICARKKVWETRRKNMGA